MEEEEKLRHGRTLKAVLSLLHTHAASLAHAPRRSACLGSPRAQQETKQLPSSGRKPRGTRSRILIPSVSGPAPATAAVVTRTAGNDHAHSGLGFPFNPRDRTEVFVKETPAVSLNLGLFSSIAAGRKATERYCKQHYTSPNPGHASSHPASGLTQKPHRAERFPARTKRSALTFSDRSSEALVITPLLTTRIVPLPAAPHKSREEA